MKMTNEQLFKDVRFLVLLPYQILKLQVRNG